MSKNVTKFITPRVVCTNIPNRVLCWFDFFTVYYNCLNKNVRKLISPRVLCASVTNRVLSWFDFFSVITTVWANMSENSYLGEFFAQRSPIVFLADLTVLRTISTVWEKKFTKLISALVLCTSLPNRVLSCFDRFTFFYNCMKENVTKLIYARVLCTSVTNRVHCWFDQFTA